MAGRIGGVRWSVQTAGPGREFRIAGGMNGGKGEVEARESDACLVAAAVFKTVRGE
jgi:hypothetical protein